MSRQKKAAPLLKQIDAWSFSRWYTYERCPFKAKLKFIDKLAEPTNEAMARGREVHNKSDRYLKAKLAGRDKLELPEELVPLKAQYEEAVACGAESETKLAVTNGWEETGYFEVDTWCRVVMDMTYQVDDRVLKVPDLKTGKLSDDYDAQLELYAAACLAVYDIDAVIPELWYCDQGEIRGGKEEGFVFEQGDLPSLVNEWEKRTTAMLNDRRFQPTPSYLCQWCHFRKENGGPCRY